MRVRARRCAYALSALCATAAALWIFVPDASATQYQRPLVEIFGSAAQPSFSAPAVIAVDPTTNDVLIGDRVSLGSGIGTISRFHADGTPAPFGALGTNTIDGVGSQAGCTYPPTPSPECDGTPQGQLEIESGITEQIAVSPISGDIFVTQRVANLVDVFSSEGKYLGQLTRAGGKLGYACGVVVDAAGAVYVSQEGGKISKFVPSGNPPVNADFTANFEVGHEQTCHMALGTGSSAGSLFVANNGGNNPGPRILKVDKDTGAFTEFAAGYSKLVAVDPVTGNPLVGATVNPSTGVPVEFESGTPPEFVEFSGAGAAAASALSRLSVVEGSHPHFGDMDIAANSSGDIYAVAGLASPNVFVYGRPVVAPTVALNSASEITSTGAILSGTVNPEGVEVTECSFEYGRTDSEGHINWEEYESPCEGWNPTDLSEREVHATISGLVPNGSKYQFRLAATNTNRVTERSGVRSLSTGSSAETKAATVTGLRTATLNGSVHPEGGQYTQCFFEWGLAGQAGYEHTALCTPKAAEIPADTGAHSVSAALTGLQEGTVYHFRVVTAKAAGILQEGEAETFETLGRPRVDALRASDATQSAATLEAEIDPRGFPTSFRFEWGPTASYGHVAPAGFESIGSGTSPVRVSADISGLSAGTTYHYRVVASGGAGTSQSPDQELETLNSCGLPDGRCLELVSPRDPGQVALPGQGRAEFELPYQASDAPGSLAYEAELGFPGATTGGEILYVGSRGPGGWETAQYTPGLIGASHGGGVRATVLGLAADLDCGVVASRLPLTGDPVARVNIEAGGGNLYQRSSTGSYTLITDVPPELPGATGESNKEFELIGMSADCGRVVFATKQAYSGVPRTESGMHLYEWEEGKLRSVGWVPSVGGEVPAEAVGGSGHNVYNAVSDDGSRIFFTATSEDGNDSGQQAVFVRIGGTETLDVSQSSLAVDTGATYQGATPDGSRVYFTANAGLTANSSSEGRDLYECHIVTGPDGKSACELTDLSIDHDPGGAEAGAEVGGEVGALLGVADDGSHVYFIARGQLAPGRGNTLAQNETADSFSIYAYDASSKLVKFVGAISYEGRSGGVPNPEVVSTMNSIFTTSRVSDNGRYLLFESNLNLTNYDSGGKQMAYLYTAPTESSPDGNLECLSCRQDGRPSLNKSGIDARPLAFVGPSNRTYQPQSLVVQNGQPRVFFRSRDRLASGGTEGEYGLYEWAHGQLFDIAGDLPGATPTAGEGPGTLVFKGASVDGTDLYFIDSAALNWENPNARRSVWDARVGGGFPEPPHAAAACNPVSESSCQGAVAPPPSSPSAGSSTLNGPGNVKVKKKHHKKKHHKKKHHKKKNGKQRDARRAGDNRGAGK